MGNNCEVKLTCEDINMNEENCEAEMEDCDDNFNPEVQIKHNHHSARFTCTDNTYCSTVSPTICANETTTTTTITMTTSVPYCETAHTTTPSPVIGHISPTPAIIMTTVITSVPYCEPTHTTHNCETTTCSIPHSEQN